MAKVLREQAETQTMPPVMTMKVYCTGQAASYRSEWVE
jgi:hypothetical protein